MHETALMTNLIATIEQALEDRHDVTRVSRVHVSVGKLSNALPEALHFAFEALTQEGILSGAELVLKSLPTIACCEQCGCEYEVDAFPFICPDCTSAHFFIIRGEEVYVESIEIEEDASHDTVKD